MDPVTLSFSLLVSSLPMTQIGLYRGERKEGVFSPYLLLFAPTLNAIPQRGNSHMNVIGVSMTSLGVESADFGLI